MDVSHEADLASVRRILEGDEAAFIELVRRLQRPLLRLAEVYVGKGPAAEEIVQEAWVGFIDGLARFEGRSSLQTWLGSIVVNKARTRRVKESRERPLLDQDAWEEPDAGRFSGLGFWSAPPKQNPSAHDLIEQRDLRRFILEEVDRLPPGQRAVITLRDIEEWSSEEVCNVLGLTETNQRVLLHRARTRLRAALERRLSRDA
jgi:RNA polymerase sigma-70 factor (ECF subfamily)